MMVSLWLPHGCHHHFKVIFKCCEGPILSGAAAQRAEALLSLREGCGPFGSREGTQQGRGETRVPCGILKRLENYYSVSVAAMRTLSHLAWPFERVTQLFSELSWLNGNLKLVR